MTTIKLIPNLLTDDVLTALLKVIQFPAMYSANENMSTFFRIE